MESLCEWPDTLTDVKGILTSSPVEAGTAAANCIAPAARRARKPEENFMMSMWRLNVEYLSER